MADINVHGELEITIAGQSYGITCPFQTNVTCCTSNGTFTFFYAAGGGITLCPPGSPPWNKDITWADMCGLNNQPNDAQKVFCDPCANKCNKDGCGGKYQGEYKWLFERYINKNNNPVSIPLKTFTVSGGVDDNNPNAGCGTNKVCVNGTCICCNEGGTADVDLGTVSKDVTELLKAHVQQFITVSYLDDPEAVCACECPGCGPSLDFTCGDFNINDLLNIMRETEANNCQATCTTQ